MTVTRALCALPLASDVSSEVMRAIALKHRPTEQSLNRTVIHKIII